MACAYTFNQVTLFYSEKMLLDGVNLTISDGDRIGVVGRNGAGKSSLLRLLAGLEAPDRGDIAIRRNISVAYLPQTPALRPEDTITQAALTYLPARPGEDVNAAAYEAQTILTQLGFTDLSQPVGQLSGGQQMRVALAGVLCRESDVLLLDEPTNHIDLDMAQWLEDRLMQRKGTLIVVTHDRYLLERVFSRIFHVGGGRVDTFQTDYAGYLEERAQREEMEAATLRKNKSLYRKELAWIRRGAQARSTKAKGRIQRFDALTDAIREAPEEERLTMKSVASRLGKKILSWEHLDVAIGGHTLVKDFSYTLLRDDRLGIIGGNGAGKTTLLRTLCGEIPPAAGAIEQGDTVRIGYFAQHCPPMDPDMRIIDAVRDVAVKVYTPDGELSASQMAVGHGGEHDGHLQLELGRGVVDELTVFVPADALRPGAQIHAGLHGLTQGVDGWVGHLGSVDEQLVPVHGQGRRVAHGGKQHAAGLRLAVDFRHGLARPVHVVLEGIVGLDDFEGAGGAQGDAALAVDAGALVGNHQTQLLIVLVNLVGALTLAHPAGDAAILVADNLIGRIEKINSHQALPPSRVKITGWPPRGAQTCFTSGAMRRMAHSSLAT